MREAIEKASRAQAELERRVFQLKSLHKAASELSRLTQPRRIMETFLLTALGLFGAMRGLALLVNTQTRQGHLIQRGLTPLEAEACERNLGVARGGTTADLRFTLDTVNCLGSCALAPVVMVDNDYLGRATIRNLKKRLDESDDGSD